MKRSALLSTTCIISFIICGLFIILYSLAITAMGIAETVSNDMDEAMQKLAAMDDNGNVIKTSKVPVIMMWTFIIGGFFAVLLNLIGTVKMWKMRKGGFMIYLIGALIACGISVYTNGVNDSLVTLIVYGVLVVLFMISSKVTTEQPLT